MHGVRVHELTAVSTCGLHGPQATAGRRRMLLVIGMWLEV